MLSTFYPASVNTNLVEISDGPLKEKHTTSLTDKDTEVPETFAGSLSSPQSPVFGRLCTHLKFQINHQKSGLVPTQVFDFMGMNFVQYLGKVFITEKNLAKVVAAAGGLGQVDQAPARERQSLVEILQVQITLIPQSQLGCDQSSLIFIPDGINSGTHPVRRSLSLLRFESCYSGGQLNKTSLGAFCWNLPN